MISFSISLIVLVLGYFIYGAIMEKVFGVEAKRKTPAYASRDDIDYVPMPTWKVFLIQFLNIAGLGPIFGAIMGIMFGPAAFLWIVLGTIFAGAVHDFFSGMISIRQNGASLPEIVGDQLGINVKQIMRVFSLLLMILVGAVFVINPANLLAELTPEFLDTKVWVGVIFFYYILATLLPIDKLIGNIYPVFGFALLFMAVGILVMLYFNGSNIPEFTDGLFNRQPNTEANPIFPMMFISIACGAISGFHATQSPMMARCIKNENKGRVIFYGAMVAEGIVALIWAAAAIAFTGSFESLNNTLTSATPSVLVHNISVNWLGVFGGFLAMLGVIAAPITSGDTALRSARLIAADFLKIDQSKLVKRLLVSVPIFISAFLIMMIDFKVLWRYFAWCNQSLAVFTLWAITVYLARLSKPYIITLIPAIFMSMVTISYIIFAPEGINNFIPEAYQISYEYSIAIAGVITGIFTLIFARFVIAQNKLVLDKAKIHVE